MNAIKRICSIVLALCLAVTCGVSAFAETPDGLTDGVYEGPVASEDRALQAENPAEGGEPADVPVNALHNTAISRSMTGENEMTRKLDVYSQTALREAIDAVPADIHRLVLDFRDVQYITSAGSANSGKSPACATGKFRP